MLRVVYDIQLVVELEDHQAEPTPRELEVVLEQSTASEALSSALDDRAVRLRLPQPKWGGVESNEHETVPREDATVGCH